MNKIYKISLLVILSLSINKINAMKSAKCELKYESKYESEEEFWDTMRIITGDKKVTRDFSKTFDAFDKEAKKTPDTEAKKTPDTEAKKTPDTEAKKTPDTKKELVIGILKPILFEAIMPNSKCSLEGIINKLKENNININNMINEDGNTALHQAVYLNNIIAVKTLLENGVSPFTINMKTKESPLLTAAYLNNEKIVELLIYYKAADNTVNEFYNETTRKAILFASSNKSLNTSTKIEKDILKSQLFALLDKKEKSILKSEFIEMKKILMNKFKLDLDDVKNEADRTVLHQACMKPDGEVAVEILLEIGVSPHIISSITGNTPLMDAILQNNHKIIKLLLDYGAYKDIYLCNIEKNNPIMAALKNSNTDILNLLLIAAFQNNDCNTVELLLKNPATNPNTINPKTGRTLLHEFYFANNIKMVNLLLDYNADPNIIDPKAKTTLLSLSCYANNIKMVNLLLDYNADPNIINPKTGRTPLHEICSEYNFPDDGSHSLAQILLSKCTLETINKKDFFELSLLALTRITLKPKTLQLLLEKGADPFAKDSINKMEIEHLSTRDISGNFIPNIGLKSEELIIFNALLNKMRQNNPDYFSKQNDSKPKSENTNDQYTHNQYTHNQYTHNQYTHNQYTHNQYTHNQDATNTDPHNKDFQSEETPNIVYDTLEEAKKEIGSKAYEILGISTKASSDEIRRAYKKLLIQYHPDQHDGSELAKTAFLRIQIAHDLLTNKDYRQQYNKYYGIV